MLDRYRATDHGRRDGRGPTRPAGRAAEAPRTPAGPRQWRSDGVGGMGKVQRAPERRDPRVPGKTTKDNFPVTKGETFNRFADLGL